MAEEITKMKFREYQTNKTNTQINRKNETIGLC